MMSIEDLAEFRELSGLNEPTQRDMEKKWGESQLTRQPKIHNKAPIPTAINFEPSQFGTDNTTPNGTALSGLAARLNGLLGSDSFKIERLQ